MEVAAKKRILSRRQKRVIAAVIKYSALLVLGLFFLFPFYIMFSRSLMTDADSIAMPAKFISDTLYLGSYRKVFGADIMRYFRNTMIVIGVNVVAVPFTALLCAYGFSKIEFKGRGALFAVVLSTIMMPAVVVQIPLYVIYVKLGWIGTLYPLTIPAFFGGGAINIFLLRQFMKGIPNELTEAARIDGASSFRSLMVIILPLCLPILLFIMVNTFLGVWNDFMTPLIYLRTEEKWYTLAVGIYNKYVVALGSARSPNDQMAAGVLMFVPVAVIFFIFQKQLINGVTFSGLKN